MRLHVELDIHVSYDLHRTERSNAELDIQVSYESHRTERSSVSYPIQLRASVKSRRYISCAVQTKMH